MVIHTVQLHVVAATYSVLKETQSLALKMAELDLLSAGMSALLGTKVEPRTGQDDDSTLHIRADDVFCQTYPIMTPTVEAVSLKIGEMFDLMVTHLHDEKKAIRVSGRSTIAEAKDAIAKNEGRPVDQFKLTYEGIQLEDCRSLNDYGITSAATVSWVPCLPEGGPSLSYFFDPNEFDFKYDFDFSQMKDDGKTYMRGGFEYKRPYGWKRLGLKLKGSTRMTSGLVPMGYAQKKLLENGLFRIMVRMSPTQERL